MSEPLIHRQFFGDALREFSLTPVLIMELERQTGTGIGGLCQRIFRHDFHFREISETIRLALIGGGEEPEAAAALIAAYVDPRPIVEAYALAVSVLETVMMGVPVQHVAQKRRKDNERRKSNA